MPVFCENHQISVRVSAWGKGGGGIRQDPTLPWFGPKTWSPDNDFRVQGRPFRAPEPRNVRFRRFRAESPGFGSPRRSPDPWGTRKNSFPSSYSGTCFRSPVYLKSTPGQVQGPDSCFSRFFNEITRFLPSGTEIDPGIGQISRFPGFRVESGRKIDFLDDFRRIQVPGLENLKNVIPRVIRRNFYRNRADFVEIGSDFGVFRPWRVSFSRKTGSGTLFSIPGGQNHPRFRRNRVGF